MMTGEKQDVKPSMVLAGQQPDKTNIWLMNMFRAATAGVDSTPAVQQILGVGGDEGEDDGAAEAEAAEEHAKAEAAARAQHEAAEKSAKEDKKRRNEDKKRRAA